MRRTITTIATSSTLTAVAAALLLLAGCASSGPAAGRSAPAFSAMNERGETVSLADYEGQTLILDFWAVW